MFELPPSQEVEMEMKNNLSPSPLGIKDQFIS
jgi:hypothetical protein